MRVAREGNFGCDERTQSSKLAESWPAGFDTNKNIDNNNDELLISFSNVVKLDLIFIFLIFFHKNIDEKLEK